MELSREPEADHSAPSSTFPAGCLHRGHRLPSPGGLSKPLILELVTSRWVAQHQAIILTGPTGLGKSYIACALGQKACRDGHIVIYRRTSRLFDELAQARADGPYTLALRRFAKANVLIFDDFGLERHGAAERRVRLGILDDRYDVSSTVITSQLDPKSWHAVIDDETAADSICERLAHQRPPRQARR